MHYADIKKIDIANGEGVRVSLFVSGCRHHCKGCFNEIAWNFKYGKEFTQDTVDEIIQDLDHDYVEGLSLLGGEPLEPENQEALAKLVTKVKEKYPNKNLWAWTGFRFDKDLKDKEITHYLDVLVDGQYIDELHNPTLKWKGSSNQRVIDVQKSLKDKDVVLFCE